MYNVKLVNSLQKNFRGFCHIVLNQAEKTVVLEYDSIKRQLSILLWCKNIFEVAQDEGLEWCHESIRLEASFISANKNFKK